MTRVGILVGSLRKNSFSKKLAANVAALFPEGYQTQVVEIGNLPLYNQDYDAENTTPAEYVTFRNTIKGLDAVLFVTPEYNRSVPAAVKNALDVGSRPSGSNVWSGKPAAVISNSPGNLGGFGANNHLRQFLASLNMPIIQHPEAYIGHIAELLGEDGKIHDEGATKLLQSVVDAFTDLIKKYQVSFLGDELVNQLAPVK